MNNNLKVLSQRILSAYGEAPKQTNPFKEIANKCNESFQKGLVTESEFNSAIDYFEDLMKGMGHKYFKREGTAGNYKYYYTEAEYKKAKGDLHKKLDERSDSEKKETASKLDEHLKKLQAEKKEDSEEVKEKRRANQKDMSERALKMQEEYEATLEDKIKSAFKDKESKKESNSSQKIWDFDKEGNLSLESGGSKYTIKYQNDKTQLYDLQKDGRTISSDKSVFKLQQEVKGQDVKKETGKLESKKEDSDKITLDTFKNIAKESNDVDDFISKVRNIKNVPPSVANEFNEKYGKGGSLSIKQASQNFMDEFGGKKDGKTKEETSLQEKVIENQKRKSSISESEHKANYNNFLSDLKKEKTIDGLNAKYKSISDKKEHIDMPVTMQNELADEVEKIEDKLSGGNIQKSEQPSPYDILKSDITYAFDNYENPLEITKKGSLIKSMAEVKLPLLQEDLMRTKMLCEAIKLKLQEQGVIVDEEKEFLNEVESESDMIKDDLRKYFHLKWKQKDIQSDIDTLQIVIEGIDENKSYKLTVRQIKSLK